MSTTFDGRTEPVSKPARPEPPPAMPAPPTAAAASALGWGNSGPLALAAFAVPTLMLSAINIGWVSAAITPVVFAVALMSGGLVQLIAGVIQLRTGNTFAGALFCMYAGLWLSLFAFAQFFVAAIPKTEVGHAEGVMLFAWGLFTLWMIVASFRTNAIIVSALVLLAGTLFLLGAGKYGANTGLVKAAGWLGFIAALEAAYLSCAEICEITYKKVILPIWPLAR